MIAILDGVRLTPVIPGPLVVNDVTYIGYQLKGIIGAVIRMLDVIYLPVFWSFRFEII